MSEQVLEYARPRSRMPSPLAWAVILIVTSAFSILMWRWHDDHFANYSSSSHVFRRTTSITVTMRGQIELFKIQHNDQPPAESNLAEVMLGKTNPDDIACSADDGVLGPYIQSFPTNDENGWSAVSTAPGKGIGWVYKVSGDQYTFQAVNSNGTGVLPY